MDRLYIYVQCTHLQNIIPKTVRQISVLCLPEKPSAYMILGLLIIKYRRLPIKICALLDLLLRKKDIYQRYRVLRTVTKPNDVVLDRFN